MKDPWNPQKEEIRQWAYVSDAQWPDQDFNLSVAKVHFSDLIIEFAIDDDCPKRDFFLSCAYIIVGDAVRTKYVSHTKAEVEEFIERVKATKNEQMTLLHGRAIALVNNPSSFNYDLWCSGGYAKQEI